MGAPGEGSRADLERRLEAQGAELSEAEARLAATAGILRAIAEAPGDEARALDMIARGAATLCRSHDALILIRQGDVLVPAAHYGEIVVPLDSFPMDSGMTSTRAIVERRSIHVEDLSAAEEEYPLAAAVAKEAGNKTTLAAPLLGAEGAIGTIFVRRQEVAPFTDAQIAMLETFADQAVIAIENARLFEQVETRTHELSEALHLQTATADVLKVISRSTFDLDVVLDVLLKTAVGLCESDGGTITRQMADGVFVRSGFLGKNDAFRELVKDVVVVPDRGTLSGRALLDSKTVHIADLREDPEYTWREIIEVGGIRSCLGVPLLREGVAVGVMALTRNEVRPFTPRQIEMVETFADQAVIAIENARLFEEVNQRTAELEQSLTFQTATSEVLAAIGRSPAGAEEVLDRIVATFGDLCEADFAIVFLRGEDGLYHAAAVHPPEEKYVSFLRTHPIEPTHGTTTGRAVLERRTIHIEDSAADPDYHWSEWIELSGSRTALGVPLVRDGEAVGVIAASRTRVAPFSKRQIDLFETFADQAAIAVSNAKLFDDLQNRTRELAASLEDLRQAQDRLVQTEKLASLGQLTAGIAHEIKNPLNFVNNFSALSADLIGELLETVAALDATPEQRAEIDEVGAMLRENLGRVVQHGKRADSIVRNMLLHSRAGTGEHRVADINAIVEESLNLAYHGARAERPDFQITLEKALDPAAGEADVYPQEITRALLNLITNGFHATRDRARANADGYAPTLAATTRAVEGAVEIRIRDNGVGMSEEVRGRMFDPFFTTKPAGEGTGLGLSLTHDIIVKQHRGALTVESEPGAFTEFRIVLPRGGAGG